MAVITDLDSYPMGSVWDTLSSTEKMEYVNLAVSGTAEFGYAGIGAYNTAQEIGLLAAYVRYIVDRQASSDDALGLEPPFYIQRALWRISGTPTNFSRDPLNPAPETPEVQPGQPGSTSGLAPINFRYENVP